MELETLQLLWFALLGVLLTGYAILDGFDLGVGILHPLARTDGERRLFLNSIGPIWDGNEVWLVTFGGALFAAFPEAYATAFSAFYTPFMILLFCLIFRAVSMEFRSKRPDPRWRAFWDWAFCVSSLVTTLLFGVAVGDMIGGIPIGADKEFAGSFLDLVQPYSLLVGCLTAALFAMHGAIFLHLKTEGEVQERLKGWMWRTFGVFMALYILTTIVTLVRIPAAARHFADWPAAWIVVVVNVLAVANIPRSIHIGRPLQAFVSSAAAIAALVALFGVALFPNMVASSLDPAFSLTIHNASSSRLTLKIMALIALLGMPFVLAYTAAIYWVFRGKARVDAFGY